MIGQGVELDIEPALRPFADASRTGEQLWQQGLGLDHDWTSGAPDGWRYLVAQLPVPRLPALPTAPAPSRVPDEGAARVGSGRPRWWPRHR